MSVYDVDVQCEVPKDSSTPSDGAGPPQVATLAYRESWERTFGMKPKDLKPFRILIRSTNWLGDAVMSVPAVRAIKRGLDPAGILNPGKVIRVTESQTERSSHSYARHGVS